MRYPLIWVLVNITLLILSSPVCITNPVMGFQNRIELVFDVMVGIKDSGVYFTRINFESVNDKIDVQSRSSEKISSIIIIVIIMPLHNHSWKTRTAADALEVISDLCSVKW